MVAYRRYREDLGGYWAAEQLERLHLESLYSEVSVEKKLGGNRNSIVHSCREKYDLDFHSIRVTLCGQACISEQAVPLQSLQGFYATHGRYAQLSLLYPEARVKNNTMALDVVPAYRKTFDGTVWPDVAYKAVLERGGGLYERAKRVAMKEHLIIRINRNK